MTILDSLQAIRSFLDSNVAQKILMQNENAEDPSAEGTYVHPTVDVCYFPHRNFEPRQFRVPCILVMLDEDDDRDDGSTTAIRLVFGAYGGGNYEGAVTGIPDNRGYIDLLNLMEKAKEALLSEGIIIGQCSISRPYKIGMYDTQVTWPYWYGYSIFSAERADSVPVPGALNF